MADSTRHFVLGFTHCSVPGDFSEFAQVLNEKDLFLLAWKHRKDIGSKFTLFEHIWCPVFL